VSDSGPYFYAWCDEADRVDAFAAALSALAYPDAHNVVVIDSVLRSESERWHDAISIGEIIALTHAYFDSGTHVRASFRVGLPWGPTSFSLDCYGEEFTRRYPTSGPLEGCGFYAEHLYGERMEVVFPSRGRSLTCEAVINSMRVQHDTESVMLRLCASDERKRITTGGLSRIGWFAPVELSATYHAHVQEIARDIALSWVHLQDGDVLNRASGLSLEALASRVDAAPDCACVGVAPTARWRDEHATMDIEAQKGRDTRPPRRDLARKGSRAILTGDEVLTREQVLAVLKTPPGVLLDALEAAAVPDDEWLRIEPLALDMIEAKKQGAPTIEVNMTTGHHVRFIEQHAPYHVRRLPNGGVLLATHPYRTLWQLWADALLLLGIRAEE
jgi:hypothetical protein